MSQGLDSTDAANAKTTPCIEAVDRHDPDYSLLPFSYNPSVPQKMHDPGKVLKALHLPLSLSLPEPLRHVPSPLLGYQQGAFQYCFRFELSLNQKVRIYERDADLVRQSESLTEERITDTTFSRNGRDVSCKEIT